MNTVLIKKLLDKFSLKDLYDEIKNNDKMIYTIGIALASKKKSVFCSFIRGIIEDTISSGNHDMSDFFKAEIIEMDGCEELSINNTAKRKISTSSKPVATSSADTDACGRGFVSRSTC